MEGTIVSGKPFFGTEERQDECDRRQRYCSSPRCRACPKRLPMSNRAAKDANGGRRARVASDGLTKFKVLCIIAKSDRLTALPTPSGVAGGHTGRGGGTGGEGRLDRGGAGCVDGIDHGQPVPSAFQGRTGESLKSQFATGHAKSGIRCSLVWEQVGGDTWRLRSFVMNEISILRRPWYGRSARDGGHEEQPLG